MREPQVKPTWKDYKCGASVGRGHVLLAWRSVGGGTEAGKLQKLIDQGLAVDHARRACVIFTRPGSTPVS